jgi:hypothetical protein
MSPEETVAAVDPSLSFIGAIHYFDAGVVAKSKEAGLDGFRMYFLGRGGVLGDVESEVVWSAFGYFHRALVKKMWDSASERMSPRDASRNYLDWAEDLGREKFADVEGLDAFNESAAELIAAVNPAALALFAGYSGEQAPADAAGAAMFNAIVLRELRGSVHLAAIVSHGLDPVVAHAIRRPNDGKMFGWDELPAPTDADRALLAEIDATTDARMAQHYGLLTAEQRQALADGTAALAAALS